MSGGGLGNIDQHVLTSAVFLAKVMIMSGDALSRGRFDKATVWLRHLW